MTTVLDQEAARHAVIADQWDVAEYDATRDKMPMLAAAENELRNVNWTGDRMMHDLWQLLYQPLPELRDPVDPSFAVNAAVAREVRDCDAVKDTRVHTVNNPAASALGAAAMRAHLRNVYRQLEEVQRKADEAQRALDEAREAQQQAGGAGAGQPGDDDEASPSSPGAGAPSDEELDALVDAATAARDLLDAAIDERVPAIGKAVREAAAAAAAEAEDNADKAAAWGLTPGLAAEMDPADYLEFLKDVSQLDLRRIADLIGSMRNDLRGHRERDTNRIPTEVYDVELGDNLDRLLPIEYVNLAVDELTDDFYRRYSERQLLVYKMRGKERAARGPIVFLEDSSDSMFWHGGDRHRWARSLGSALLSIAVDDRRGFEAVVFGGPGQIKAFRFDEPADYTPKRQLAYAKFRFTDAGTDFVTPLNHALTYMQAEFAAKGRVESDIVLATDGDCQVPDEWLAAFKAEQARLKFRVFGLAVAMPSFKTLDDICDGRVARVDRLIDVSDIQELLQDLTR